MNSQPFLLSSKLSRVLLKINSLHRFHGLTILNDMNRRSSCYYKAWIVFSRTAVALQMGLFLIGALPSFTTNQRIEMMVCIFAVIMSVEIILQELLFVAQKKNVIELVNWCHRVETTKYSICVRPQNWFDEPRNTSLKLVRTYVVIAICYILTVFFGMAPALSLYNDYPTLAYYINIKGYEEREHYWVFLIEFFIGLIGTTVIAQLCMFSLSFFILFTSYIIAQFNLGAKFVSELPLNDAKLCAAHLNDITELHVDALGSVRKLSDLYKITLKLHEILLYCGVAIALIGKEGSHLDTLTVPGYFIGFIGFYSYTVEKIIQAEENIRLSYHCLNWETANVEVRKMLLIAMQQPRIVTVGGIFGKDRTSCERFTMVLRQAYDFGLFLLKVTTD